MFAEADRDVTAEAAHRLGGEPDLVSEPVSGDGWGQQKPVVIRSCRGSPPGPCSATPSDRLHPRQDRR